MHVQAKTTPQSWLMTSQGRSVFITAALGLLIIFSVGFMQGQANLLHNAAHDTRHSLSFPCH